MDASASGHKINPPKLATLHASTTPSLASVAYASYLSPYRPATPSLVVGRVFFSDQKTGSCRDFCNFSALPLCFRTTAAFHFVRVHRPDSDNSGTRALLGILGL